MAPANRQRRDTQSHLLEQRQRRRQFVRSAADPARSRRIDIDEQHPPLGDVSVARRRVGTIHDAIVGASTQDRIHGVGRDEDVRAPIPTRDSFTGTFDVVEVTGRSEPVRTVLRDADLERATGFMEQ